VWRRVTRSVVDEQQLVRRPRLPDHRLEEDRQVLGLVQERNHQRNPHVQHLESGDIRL
jgi:hypothetical protein